LVCQVQRYPRDTQERQQALGKLVKQILRSRKICRPSKGQPLSGIYLNTLAVYAVNFYLRCLILPSLNRTRPASGKARRL
ncbi:hypothetical protein, partial [Moorena sp. SIO2C4]